MPLFFTRTSGVSFMPRADSYLSLTRRTPCVTSHADQMPQNALFRRTLCSLRISPPAPYRRRKASFATPREFCGVFAFVPASPLRVTKIRTFATLLVSPLRRKLSRCSLIFAPRGGLCRCFSQGRAGFPLRRGRIVFYRGVSLSGRRSTYRGRRTSRSPRLWIGDMRRHRRR